MEQGMDLRWSFFKPVPLPKYIKRKIKMLERDMCIELTDEEKDHFHALTNEIAVDNYAHKLIVDKL